MGRSELPQQLHPLLLGHPQAAHGHKGPGDGAAHGAAAHASPEIQGQGVGLLLGQPHIPGKGDEHRLGAVVVHLGVCPQGLAMFFSRHGLYAPFRMN